jgi:hypothetical protein
MLGRAEHAAIERAFCCAFMCLATFCPSPAANDETFTLAVPL